MYMSDRAVAVIYFLAGVFVPIGLHFLFPLPLPPSSDLVATYNRYQTYELIGFVILGMFMWIIGAWIYSRNRPVFGGRSEDDCRRNIKRWYRDAKKWMDEHPEDVEMKDL